MIEKAKFDKAGGFDEAFEVTHNDVDICLTLYEQGYYNVLRNDVVLFHHESFSRGDDEVDEEKNRRNMHARDMTYENIQSLRNMTLSIVRFLRRRRITTDSEMRYIL